MVAHHEHKAQALRAELPCVWVSAGVLSYRLCDRQYDCEGCQLYHALKREAQGGSEAVTLAAGTGAEAAPESAGADDPVARLLAALGTGCTLHLDRAYSAEGLWLAAEPGELVRVGMDDYTLRLLQPADDVVLPRPGVWLRRGAPCAWIHRGRMQIPLHAPLSGEVLEVHSCPTVTAPAGEPETARWWFVLKPHESLAMATGLYRNEALLNWFLGRVRAVHERLNGAMTLKGAGVGPVANDGGKPSGNLELVLGRGSFESLVGTLFPPE